MNSLSLRCPSCGKWLEVEDWESDNLTITLFTWCECGRFYEVKARVDLNFKEVWTPVELGDG